MRRAAEYALDLARDPARLRARPGEAYAELAHAHPLLDGNGRTIAVVHAELTRRAGFHIDWPNVPKDAFLDALTRTLRHPAGHALDQFLVPHMRDGPLPLRAAAHRLSSNPALNPTGVSRADDGRPAET